MLTKAKFLKSLTDTFSVLSFFSMFINSEDINSSFPHSCQHSKKILFFPLEIILPCRIFFVCFYFLWDFIWLVGFEIRHHQNGSTLPFLLASYLGDTVHPQQLVSSTVLGSSKAHRAVCSSPCWGFYIIEFICVSLCQKPSSKQVLTNSTCQQSLRVR